MKFASTLALALTTYLVSAVRMSTSNAEGFDGLECLFPDETWVCTGAASVAESNLKSCVQYPEEPD